MSTCLKDLTVDPENLGQLQTLFLERGTTDRPGFKMSKEFEMKSVIDSFGISLMEHAGHILPKTAVARSQVKVAGFLVCSQSFCTLPLVSVM